MEEFEMGQSTCEICEKVCKTGNVTTCDGRIDICAMCAERPCPACGVTIARTEVRTKVLDCAYSYTAADGSVKHVQLKIRAHAPIDSLHQAFNKNPAVFLRTRREGIERARAASQKPITPAAPRFSVVPNQTTVAP